MCQLTEMSEISDADLRKRLAFFPGVEVPPITPATKNLLINKLNRLEKQHGQKSGKKISSTNQVRTQVSVYVRTRCEPVAK